MSVNWREALRPEVTTVLCMEMQQGVLAADGPFPQLADAVQKHQIVSNGEAVLAAARKCGINVVHCTAAFRADRKGTPVNTPLVASLLKNKTHMLEDSSAINVIPQWLGAGDLESRRYHGVSPFAATELDATLRNRNIQTVVVMGVSLNLGVTGLCVEAANLGYRVVVVVDAVAGFPEAYAQAVLTNTVSLIAKCMHSNEVIPYFHQGMQPGETR